jgi:hypothetical protein
MVTGSRPAGGDAGRRNDNIESILRQVSRIEAFLQDVLRLEGESQAHIGECVRFYVAQYELMFRAAEQNERNKDLAARVCRAMCRSRVIKEIEQRGGTPTEVHLKIVLDAIEPPSFSLKDR